MHDMMFTGVEGSVFISSLPDSTIRSISTIDGSVRWASRFSGVRTGMTATAERVYLLSPYVSVYDARTGAYLGRSVEPVHWQEVSAICDANAFLVASNARVIRYDRC